MKSRDESRGFFFGSEERAEWPQSAQRTQKVRPSWIYIGQGDVDAPAQSLLNFVVFFVRFVTIPLQLRRSSTRHHLELAKPSRQ
jgi:hypothetical protein